MSFILCNHVAKSVITLLISYYVGEAVSPSLTRPLFSSWLKPELTWGPVLLKILNSDMK